MNKIVSKRFFSEKVAEIVIEAALIARSRKAGHFVIVRVDSQSERIPLTISDADEEKGTISLVVQAVGVSSSKLLSLDAGDYVEDVVGPLGKATDIQCFGTVLCACGGVGAAPMLPIAQALKKKGNRVITILAARTADLLILKNELGQTSDELVVMTDDGSEGIKGVITQGIEAILEKEKINKCITIGPAIMMKFVALTTAKYDIPTDASLNTIMVDGTGMCGACRVTVDGKTKFVCIDGPEFDAHKVDFDEMLIRLGTYKDTEKADMEAFLSATKPLSAKERTQIARVKMNELPPERRLRSLHEEVNMGLTREQAVQEAHRCLHCKTPTCVQGCPVNIDIPHFIEQIERGNMLKAAAIIKESSTLPAVCGRVCPQEKQCEAQCIHNKMQHEPVAIGYLERFVADYANEHSEPITPIQPAENAPKIAVVGSGPAGLSFAGDMVKYGYAVTVFEALHDIGGVLKYGIPEFRLPNRIVDLEIASLRLKGVQFVKNTIVGKTISVDQLKKEGFDGIFVASGAGLPRFMNIPGENLIGVMSCNEYLTRVNLMQASDETSDTPLLRGKNVAVVGGGNTAMDAVRTAKRLGAQKAYIVYRRSEREMPARIEEVRHAKEEGIEFLTLHNPIEYHADEQGRVKEVLLQVMTLGEADASGRRSPVPIKDKTLTLPIDLAIVSIGVSPNPIIPNNVAGLQVSDKGTIVVEDGTMQSSIPTIFAGGDIVRGGATVILAMSDGRKAARAMHDYLSKNRPQG